MSNVKLKTLNHAAFSLHYHVVFSIKYRHKCLTKNMLEQLKLTFEETCRSWRCTLVDFGGEQDHVHLLIEAHPSLDLSRMIGNLKTVSARRLRKEFEAELRHFFWKTKFWNNAYAVISAGGHASIEQLLEYIQDQEQPPR